MSNNSNIKGKNHLQQTRVHFKGNFVTLRGRTGIKGESLYLDYHITENGKKIRKYLFLKKLEIKNTFTRDQQKENISLAVTLAMEADRKLKNGEYDQVTEYSLKLDFIKYFENYIANYKRNDFKMFKYCLTHFKSFLQSINLKTIQGKQIDESLVFGFKEYLMNKDGLNGETPSSYFKRFKKLLKQAKRDKVIKGEPEVFAVTIKTNKNQFTKDVLTLDELIILKNTDCGNEIVKRAFLFSAMTGLRFVDVKQIQWKNITQIELDGIKNNVLKFKQEKTGTELITILNKTSLEMAGIPGDPESIIFDLPSFSYCMRALDDWKNKAGLTKHVTWHVSRHSFATNLLIEGTDVKTTAGLLGHSGLGDVNRYVRLVESLKQKAVNSIEL